LFILIGYIYAPALRHAPRADQWAYYADTLDRDSFFDLIAHTYSYNRTRIVFPGDTHLYRPLFFVVLAAQKSAFGTHFEWCEVSGIVLHCLACWLLFTILRRMRALASGPEPPRFSPCDLLPYVLTVFFALNFAVVEQVIWFNIAGYLVFVILLLAALLMLLEVMAGTVPTRRRETLLVGCAWLLVLLAAFTYELGQFCAVLIGLGLAAAAARERRYRRALVQLGLFVAIAVIFQAVDQIDRWYQRGNFVDDLKTAEILDGIATPLTIRNAERYVLFVLVQPFLPLRCTTFMPSFGKLHVEELLWTGALTQTTPDVVFGFVVCGVGLLLTLLGLTRRDRLLPLVGTALGIAFCHGTIVVLGRLNMRPQGIYLSCNSYYAYIDVLFVLLGVAVPLLALDRLRSGLLSVCTRAGGGALVAGLLVLCVCHMKATHQINGRSARAFRPFHFWHDPLAEFVRQNEHEPDFRFAVLQTDPKQTHAAGNLMLLYHSYIDTTRPTYLVALEEGKVHAVPVKRWRAEHPGETPRFYPQLVRVEPLYYVMWADNRYYGVEHLRLEEFLSARDRSGFHPNREALPDLLERIAELKRDFDEVARRR
jgi:hypothetical protein